MSTPVDTVMQRAYLLLVLHAYAMTMSMNEEGRLHNAPSNNPLTEKTPLIGGENDKTTGGYWPAVSLRNVKRVVIVSAALGVCDYDDDMMLLILVSGTSIVMSKHHDNKHSRDLSDVGWTSLHGMCV
mmetsp:Transcript_11535/g.22147  ORF Transcript_11535/g.22147 Transcript_11535/m.22147 type:complete len:127 (-) Transcript_11535:3058-3438(-)